MNIFSKRPLFTACMLFLLFSVVGYFSPVMLKPILCIICGVVIIAFLICLKIRLIKSYTALCVTLSLGMIIAALLSSYFYFDVTEKSFQKYYDKEHTVEGFVVSERYHDGGFSGYDIIVTGINGESHRHKAILSCQYDSVLESGNEFCARVKGEAFTDTIGSYDQRLAMHSDRIFIQYLSDDENTLFITQKNVLHPKVLFARMNAKLSMIFRIHLSKEAAAMSSAILLGNKDHLDSTVQRDFARAGVSHVLALSGMHMSIIMGLLMILLKKLRITPKLIALILMACALFYLFLTGAPISAVRSVIMLLTVYLAILSDRRADSLTSLSLAGMLLMLLFPGAVIDAGFWMSFAATLGLLVYLPAFNQFINTLLLSFTKYKLLLKPIVYLVGALATGIFAMVPLLIVLCIFIKEISVFSILSSAVLAIPAAGMILFSLLFLPFAEIPVLSDGLRNILESVNHFMTGYCSAVSDMEHVVVSLNYPFATVAAIILCITLIYSLICKSRNLFRSLIPFALAVILFISAATIYDAAETENVKVSYVNASSQSDMMVLTNNKEGIICDIGNGSKSSYMTTFRSLSDARVTEIKAILLSQCTYAHLASLYDIFTNEKVRELWLPYPQDQDEYYKTLPLVELAERYGVEVYVYEEGESLSLFHYTGIELYRYHLKRSTVPIFLVSIETRKQRLLYCSPAFNEVMGEDAAQIEGLLKKSEYVIFGSRGPKIKQSYTIPEENDADLIIFCDETRVAYYENKEGMNVTYAMLADVGVIIMKE